MAKTITEFTKAPRAHGTKKPWEEWLDGQIWLLDEEDFGEATAATVAFQARKYAARMGKKVRISENKDESTLELQAFDMTDEEKENYEDKEARRKEREKDKRKEKKVAEKNGHAEPASVSKPPAKKGKKQRV